MTEDQKDIVSKAMRKTFQLGQLYWQQADSEYQSQWSKSDATYKSFLELIDKTLEQLEVEEEQ